MEVRRGRATVTGRVSPEARNSIPRTLFGPGTHDPEEGPSLSDTTITPEPRAPSAPIVPLYDLVPYAIFVALIAFLLLYFVGAEEGAMAMVPGETVHEWVHDARHLLGFPCH